MRGIEAQLYIFRANTADRLSEDNRPFLLLILFFKVLAHCAEVAVPKVINILFSIEGHQENILFSGS